ncbi:MAG TPA: nuclear transport factor 2 family protein [Ramlibacter sp.]|nr:nuclear transport factor 2 family protein [Ramlibacter sp.]
MGIEQNKDVVVRFTRLIEQGDVDGALALTSEDCTFWHPLSGETGKVQTGAVMKQMLPAMSAFRSEISSVTAEDDRVSLEVEVHATAPGGKPYHNRYHFMYVVRDGKIMASREYLDTAPVLQAFSQERIS